MASLIKKLKEERENLQSIALQKAEEMNELKTLWIYPQAVVWQTHQRFWGDICAEGENSAC